MPDGWGDVVTFAPGSLYMSEGQTVALLVQHQEHQPAAGYATNVWTDETGTVRATFETLPTPTGLALEAELTAPQPVRTDVSVGVYLDAYTSEPLDPADPSPSAPVRMTVTAGDLAETSACLRGRFPSARIESVESVEPTNTTPEGTE